ncbi:hypothetical protein EIP75_05635 [Aquabacterium soli]|uniref:Uncharacterized protein n=1 Tax=Aquabacterium soli TaxID=2493092 RepID=A0A426VDX9_9BURK|nr:hypothetical protein [Aquabacterium soli]RRS05059.1 hypothetical protein EIP75_05635 [Aquabacterium soli]
MAVELKDEIMTVKKQHLPHITIEQLPSGLLRVEDPSYSESCCIDLHPHQIALLSAMAGRPMPDRTRAAVGKLQGRVEALHSRARELVRLLEGALKEGEGVGVELTSAEHITDRLSDLAQDLAELVDAPEPGEPLATEGVGGQLTLAA